MILNRPTDLFNQFIYNFFSPPKSTDLLYRKSTYNKLLGITHASTITYRATCISPRANYHVSCHANRDYACHDTLFLNQIPFFWSDRPTSSLQDIFFETPDRPTDRPAWCLELFLLRPFDLVRKIFPAKNILGGNRTRDPPRVRRT